MSSIYFYFILEVCNYSIAYSYFKPEKTERLPY